MQLHILRMSKDDHAWELASGSRPTVPSLSLAVPLLLVLPPMDMENN